MLCSGGPTGLTGFIKMMSVYCKLNASCPCLVMKTNAALNHWVSIYSVHVFLQFLVVVGGLNSANSQSVSSSYFQIFIAR